MSWTEERVELLKSMWNEGKSASQIAKALGGVTRNAVIGKVHRLGLSNRTNGTPGKDEPKPGSAATAQPSEEAPVTPVSDEIPPMASTTDEKPVEEVRPAGPRDTGASRQGGVVAGPGQAPAGAVNGSANGAAATGPGTPPAPAVPDVSEEALANLVDVERRARKLNLMQLTERTCKWPIGDPATDEFWFCGLPVEPGKPYCEAHVAIAFQPMSSRRDRRASNR
ncbi:MAG: GcrA family cell cycle regulator [Pseudomonadota bacterium]